MESKLMEEIRLYNQLRLVVYPIIYRCLYIPGGCLRFQPSTVSSWCVPKLSLLNMFLYKTLLQMFLWISEASAESGCCVARSTGFPSSNLYDYLPSEELQPEKSSTPSLGGEGIAEVWLVRHSDLNIKTHWAMACLVQHWKRNYYCCLKIHW